KLWHTRATSRAQAGNAKAPLSRAAPCAVRGCCWAPAIGTRPVRRSAQEQPRSQPCTPGPVGTREARPFGTGTDRRPQRPRAVNPAPRGSLVLEPIGQWSDQLAAVRTEPGGSAA